MTNRTCTLGAALALLGASFAAGQTEPTAPRSTTERPNMSAPGLEKTLTGVLMDASCSAIADSRSELTSTPRIVPKDASRARTERTQESVAADSSVPDTYSGCKLKGSTTSFALYSNGKVYMLDRVSNQMMQDSMSKANSDAQDGSKWINKTLVGTATSDNVLTLRTIKK